jgi:D-ribose pyranose/furanose isomerase RbsD
LSGVKHIVECHCVLPQYRNRKEVEYHKFVVFSIYDNTGGVIPKLAQCNNCGVIHNVIDLCKSEIMVGKENSLVMEIKDCQMLLPKSLTDILDSYNCNIADYEHVLHVIQNELWDETIVLQKLEEQTETTGKLLKISGIGNYKIEPFIIKKVI